MTDHKDDHDNLKRPTDTDPQGDPPQTDGDPQPTPAAHAALAQSFASGRGQAQAMVSRANQTISEAKTNILNLKNETLNKVVAELKDTQVQLSTLEEQARSTS